MRCKYIERKRLKYIERKRLNLRNWLIRFWGLTSQKSEGQARKMEIQERAEVEVLNPKSIWQIDKMQIYVGFLHYSSEVEILFVQKPQFLLRRSSTD